ncbi:protein NYNRIN-like [Amphibalanus amphitrite]|uniref:protein NYNRIN-like n=1 Tax=Amphibalanus amphitrite TaxID=1232801 RepID=UPI001C9123A8|nr:protein NYNRIN-like [Amphibalanus amphitrite]XP_043196728.1 protein NYNRIN-like [Amphibalanus amphitrite]
MFTEIESFCKKCPQCGSRNAPIPAPRASLGELSATEPLEVVGLDILSSLPETPSGHKNLLVVVDHFSRWVEAYPLKSQEAAEVATVFVREFVSRFGCPRRIHSDRGANFTGEVLKKTCELLGIAQSKTTAFHPMSNSIVERTNRTLINMFAKFLEQHEHAEWDRNLPLLLLGLRAQVHRSLGVSPYCVMFGREPRLPIQLELDTPLKGRTRPITDYLDELRSNLQALHRLAFDSARLSHRRNKAVYDRKINDFKFAPGDRVYLHKGVVPKGSYYKFLRPWKPAVVIAKVGDMNYRIRLDGAKATLLVHHNRLKPRARQDPDQPRSGVATDPATDPVHPTGGRGRVGDWSREVVGESQWNGHADEPAVLTRIAPDQSYVPCISHPALNLSPTVPLLTSGVPGDSGDERPDPGAGDRLSPAGTREGQTEGSETTALGDAPLRRSARSNKGVAPERLTYG